MVIILSSKSFKVTDFGSNRKLISDFLLHNNIDFVVLHVPRRFQVIADYWSNLRHRQGGGASL